MSGGRTEPPTPRRLREARRRGEVARSRELSAAAAFAAGLLALAALGPATVAALARLLRAALLSAATAAPAEVLAASATQALRAGAPLLLLPTAAAAAAAAASSGLHLSFEPLRPRMERLDPSRGLSRLLSPATLGSALLGLAKGLVLAALLWGWLSSHAAAVAQLPRLALPALWRAASLGSLAWRLAFAALAFGLLDLLLARRRHRRALWMTRDEVRREAKEDEGDPQHRAERRRLHRDLLEAGPVARATVVVVNPTHVAVALRHDRSRDEPPRLLAKGVGDAATRLRSEARRAGVPIVRDVALARAVARLVDVGETLPEPLFEAAAAVLVHVYGLEGAAR